VRLGCGGWASIKAHDEQIVTMDEFGLTRTRFTLAAWISCRRPSRWSSGP
jgi:hypothetical protein